MWVGRNVPRNRAHNRGHRWHERLPPTYLKTHLARSAVWARCRARGASMRTYRRPRSTFYRNAGAHGISNIQTRNIRASEGRTPSLTPRVSGIRTATTRALLPCGHHHTRRAATPRHSPQAQEDRSPLAQASTQVHQTRRRNATRRLGAVRRRL